jgi:hypothetical protein
MPSVKPHFCKVCGGHDSEVGYVSWRGKCAVCGNQRVLENFDQLRNHDGPWFDHWRRRTLAAFGVTGVDAPDETR